MNSNQQEGNIQQNAQIINPSMLQAQPSEIALEFANERPQTPSILEINTWTKISYLFCCCKMDSKNKLFNCITYAKLLSMAIICPILIYKQKITELIYYAIICFVFLILWQLYKYKKLQLMHPTQENQQEPIQVTAVQSEHPEQPNLNNNDSANVSSDEMDQEAREQEEQLIQARQVWQREIQNLFFSALRLNVQRINFNSPRLTDEELGNIRIYIFCLKLTFFLNQIGNPSQQIQINDDQENISISDNQNSINLRLINWSSSTETIDFLISKLQYYENKKKSDLQKAIESIPRYKFQTSESIQVQLNGDELLQGIDEWDLNQQINTSIHLKKNPDDFLCPICLEQFVQDDKIIVFSCKHEFHDSCAVEWIKNKQNCPLCKQIVVNY